MCNFYCLMYLPCLNKDDDDDDDESNYRIYSFRRPGRLLNFWVLRVRWALTKFLLSEQVVS